MRRFATVLMAGAVLAVPFAPAAAAAPAVADPVGCATLLAQVTAWPGTIQTATGTTQLRSDSYELHLLQQPVCARVGG